MSNYILILISLFVDILIPNITIYSINNITYFTPLCTLVSLGYLYSNKKAYYFLYIITTIIYSIIIMDNLIVGLIVFTIIFLILKLFNKLFVKNLMTYLIEVVFIIGIYDFLFMSLLSIVNYRFFDINLYLYKFSHSLILNIMFGFTIYFLFDEKGSKKHQ